MLETLFNFFRRRETPAARRGRLGEKAAAKYLAKAGLKIVARNYRIGRDELDIVALDGQSLVFVEVKTRTPNAVVGGFFAAVSKRKAQALRRCARAFIAKMHTRPDTWRFDVVDVELDGNEKTVSIKHYPNVRM